MSDPLYPNFNQKNKDPKSSSTLDIILAIILLLILLSLIGSVYLTRIDNCPDQHYFEDGDYAKLATSDLSGNLYIVGTTTSNDFPKSNNFSTTIDSSFISKFNSNGTLEWTKLYHQEDLSGVTQIKATDSDIFLIGHRYEPSTVKEQLLRLSTNGTELSKFDIQQNTIDLVTSSSGYFQVYKGLDGVLAVAFYDLYGNLIWYKAIESYLDQSSVHFDLINQTLVLAFFMDIAHIVLTGITLNGDISWKQILPGKNDFGLILQGENIIITGYTDRLLNTTLKSISAYDAFDIYLADYNVNGSLIWYTYYGDNGYDFPFWSGLTSNTNITIIDFKDSSEEILVFDLDGNLVEKTELSSSAFLQVPTFYNKISNSIFEFKLNSDHPYMMVNIFNITDMSNQTRYLSEFGNVDLDKVIQTPNGFAFYGETTNSSFPFVNVPEHAFKGSQQIYIVSLDFNANVVWAQQFGGSGINRTAKCQY